MTQDERNIVLFSYGTLQLEGVQRASFGRLLEGWADFIPGYRRDMLEITDPDVLRTSGEKFHPVISPSRHADDRVEGMAFYISAAELAAADSYEVSDYKRVEVELGSGTRAWVYVAA